MEVTENSELTRPILTQKKRTKKILYIQKKTFHTAGKMNFYMQIKDDDIFLCPYYNCLKFDIFLQIEIIKGDSFIHFHIQSAEK